VKKKRENGRGGARREFSSRRYVQKTPLAREKHTKTNRRISGARRGVRLAALPSASPRRESPTPIIFPIFRELVFIFLFAPAGPPLGSFFSEHLKSQPNRTTSPYTQVPSSSTSITVPSLLGPVQGRQPRFGQRGRRAWRSIDRPTLFFRRPRFRPKAQTNGSANFLSSPRNKAVAERCFETRRSTGAQTFSFDGLRVGSSAPQGNQLDFAIVLSEPRIRNHDRRRSSEQRWSNKRSLVLTTAGQSQHED